MKEKRIFIIIIALTAVSILPSFWQGTGKSCHAQNIYTVAGTGAVGYSGDGGISTSAQLNLPAGVAIDGSGNIFIADKANHRVRKVDATTGIISTIAGTGVAGYSGDGGTATSAQLNEPFGIVCDVSGNLFIADRNNHSIRKVNVSTGIISMVAGTGSGGYGGDGGAATSAQLNTPVGVVLDGLGNLFIADGANHRIRKIDALGIISTVAGTGTGGFSGDGGAATSAQLNYPYAVAFDVLSGTLFVADASNNRIRKMNASGIISTMTGTGTAGFSGDGGAATAAKLSSPIGVTLDGSGNLFIADVNNHRVRKVNASGTISTVAGTGVPGFSGDGGAATSAQLNFPYATALNPSGCLFIVDNTNHRVRGVCSVPNSVELSTSVDKGNLDILIYPNPASGNTVTALMITGQNTSAKAEVFNAVGQVVYKKDIALQKGQTEIKIPVMQLATGQYMFRVTLPTLEKVQKMFVK